MWVFIKVCLFKIKLGHLNKVFTLPSNLAKINLFWSTQFLRTATFFLFGLACFIGNRWSCPTHATWFIWLSYSAFFTASRVFFDLVVLERLAEPNGKLTCNPYMGTREWSLTPTPLNAFEPYLVSPSCKLSVQEDCCVLTWAIKQFI